MGKDTETHEDKTGEQLVTVTLTLKLGVSPCTGSIRRTKAKVSGFI